MTFVRPVHHATWQLATPTQPHDTPRMPLSLRGDFFSVNCGREQSVPAEGHAVLRSSRVCALAQAHGLQGLSALDVVHEGSPHLCDEPPAILRIPECS